MNARPTELWAGPPLRWTALVPVGPSPAELDRLDDLLAARVSHEPPPEPISLLDDGADAGALRTTLERHGLSGVILTHPRSGVGNAWMGRLTSGLVHAYRDLCERSPGVHVLKLDTDALVVAPFAARLAALLAAHPDAGVVGSVELTAEGGQTGSWFSRRVYWMSKRVSRWGCRPYLRTSFVGPRARMRKLIRLALGRGYHPGYAPCGGAYLLTGEALHRLAAFPALHDDRLVSENALTEDIFFSIAVHAAGRRSGFVTLDDRLAGPAARPPAEAAGGNGGRRG